MIRTLYVIGQMLGLGLFMFGLVSLVGLYWGAMALGLIFVVVFTAAESKTDSVMTAPPTVAGHRDKGKV